MLNNYLCITLICLNFLILRSLNVQANEYNNERPPNEIHEFINPDAVFRVCDDMKLNRKRIWPSCEETKGIEELKICRQSQEKISYVPSQEENFICIDSQSHESLAIMNDYMEKECFKQNIQSVIGIVNSEDYRELIKSFSENHNNRDLKLHYTFLPKENKSTLALVVTNSSENKEQKVDLLPISSHKQKRCNSLREKKVLGTIKKEVGYLSSKLNLRIAENTENTEDPHLPPTSVDNGPRERKPSSNYDEPKPNKTPSNSEIPR